MGWVGSEHLTGRAMYQPRWRLDTGFLILPRHTSSKAADRCLLVTFSSVEPESCVSDVGSVAFGPVATTFSARWGYHEDEVEEQCSTCLDKCLG